MAAENLRPILGSGNGVDASIQHWQADTSLGKAYGVATGPIGLLFNSILEFLGLVLVDMKTQSTISAHYQPLETISATLFFWGTDLEVTQGELDESLRDSTELRDTCLMVLISIGQYLTCSIVSFMSSNARQKEALKFTNIAACIEQAANILGEQAPLACLPEHNQAIACRVLRTKVDTLVSLGSSLASPAEETLDDEEPKAIDQVNEHLPEQFYINSVLQNFPRAESTVAHRLGQLNWKRYNHMLHLQRKAIEHEQERSALAKARTVFNDSALGSSMPAQSQAVPSATTNDKSIYAPSMVSSRAESSHRRLPALTAEARAGQPFTCVVCNKQVEFSRTKAWKKHVFQDVLAYACLYADCSQVELYFEDREGMLCHLESHHGLDVSVAEVTCPLCLELTFSDRDALSLHLARHMEEISLAVVPLDYDSDDENANKTSSSSNSTTGASDSIVNRMVEDMEKELGTRCICGLEESPHADDLLIQCDTCKAWQHGGCVGIEDESLSPNEYFCEICRGDLHRILEGPLQGQRSVYQPVKEVIDARDDEKYRSRIKQLQMENEERSSRLRQLDQAVNHLREQIWDPQLQSASERILQEESFNLSYEDWVRSSMEDNFANVGFRAELRRLFEGHGVQNIELVQLKKEVTQLQRRKQREDMLKDGKEPGHEMDAGKSTTSNPVNTTPQFTVHTPSEFPSQSIDDTLERRNYMSVPGSNAPMRQISEDESSTGSRDNGVPDAYKRDEQPPQNSEGKMVCKYSDCVGICFDRKSEWSKHMDKHDRPYKCNVKGCEKLQGFTYAGGLLRHEREVHKMHDGTKRTLFCPFPDCKRNSGSGFSRKDNLAEHIRRIHPRTSMSADTHAPIHDDLMQRGSPEIISSRASKKTVVPPSSNPYSVTGDPSGVPDAT